MPILKSGTARIYTEVHGDGDDVLLVPGLGGRAQFWNNQVAPFAKHFRVILHDHRGTGRSSRDKIKYSVQQMAEDVLRVMDHHGVRAAHYVGHSTGGAIGQYLAINHPERIRKLVLSATWAGPDRYFIALFEHRRAVLRRLGPEAYLFQGTLLATPISTLVQQIGETDDFLAARLKDFPGTAIETSRINAVMAHDLRGEVGRIAKPTLIIGAADDQITPAGFFRELKRRIKGSKLMVLPTGGHFCPMTMATDYNRHVLAFLEGRRRR